MSTDLNVLGQMPEIRAMAQKDLDETLSGALARTSVERVFLAFRYSPAYDFHVAFSRHLKNAPAPGGRAAREQHRDDLKTKHGVLVLGIAGREYYATMSSVDDLLTLFSSIV